MSEALADGLKGRGHDVQVVEMNSGLQGIQRLNVQGQTVWFGGADPRREGVALGNEGSQAWRRRALRDVVRPPGRDDALTCRCARTAHCPPARFILRIVLDTRMCPAPSASISYSSDRRPLRQSV